MWRIRKRNGKTERAKVIGCVEGRHGEKKSSFRSKTGAEAEHRWLTPPSSDSAVITRLHFNNSVRQNNSPADQYIQFYVRLILDVVLDFAEQKVAAPQIIAPIIRSKYRTHVENQSQSERAGAQFFWEDYLLPLIDRSSLCCWQDTCGPTLWCGELAQNSCRDSNSNRCLQKDAPHGC